VQWRTFPAAARLLQHAHGSIRKRERGMNVGTQSPGFYRAPPREPRVSWEDVVIAWLVVAAVGILGCVL